MHTFVATHSPHLSPRAFHLPQSPRAPNKVRLQTVKLEGTKLLSPISRVEWLQSRDALLVVNDDHVRLCT